MCVFMLYELNILVRMFVIAHTNRVACDNVKPEECSIDLIMRDWHYVISFNWKQVV